MAVDELQGIQVIGTMVSFSDKLATDEDYETLGWQTGWKTQHLRVEPQMFREKGTNAAAITFTEAVVQTTNASDVWQVEILYEIYNTG